MSSKDNIFYEEMYDHLRAEGLSHDEAIKEIKKYEEMQD